MTRQQSRKQSVLGENNFNFGSTFYPSYSPAINQTEYISNSPFVRNGNKFVEASPGIFRQPLFINKGLSTFSDNNP